MEGSSANWTLEIFRIHVQAQAAAAGMSRGVMRTSVERIRPWRQQSRLKRAGARVHASARLGILNGVISQGDKHARSLKFANNRAAHAIERFPGKREIGLNVFPGSDS